MRIGGVLVALWAGLVHGGEVLDAQVAHDGDRFTLHADIRIDLPAERVRAILTTYENLPRVNSGIDRVKILEQTGKRTRMQVEAEVCILLICREFQWVQTADITPAGEIITVIDPAVSTFREGRVHYRIIPAGEAARLVTDAELVPDVWFPPLIGPWLFKRKLYEETLETAAGVERLGADFRR